jgi:hypothetical protein
MYKITKGLPVQKKRFKMSDQLKFILSLEIGDSFVVENRKAARSLQTIAAQHKVNLTSRKQLDGKIRMWRIKLKTKKSKA